MFKVGIESQKTKLKDRGRLYRQIISSDVMGNRNVEVRPIGASVHSRNIAVVDDCDSRLSAQMEEHKIAEHQTIKQLKLKRFREDVKQRVRTKHQQEQNKLLIQQQQQQLLQDQMLWPKPRPNAGSHRQTRTTVERSNQPQVIKHIVQSELEENVKVSHKNAPDTFPITKLTRIARHKLNCHKTTSEDLAIMDTSIGADEDSLSQTDIKDSQETVEDVHKTVSEPKARIRAYAPIDAESTSYTDTQSYITNHTGHLGNRCWLSRRMFMDKDRQQVQENRRYMEHQHHKSRLTETKERQRAKEEERHNVTCKGDNSVHEDDVSKEEQLEFLLQQEKQRISTGKVQKRKEINRYIEAYKTWLYEKAERLGVTLPALCPCSESLWATSPYRCANNCIFYHNTKEFIKVLQMTEKSLNNMR